MDPQYVDAVWDMISGNTGSEENRAATSTPNGDIQRKSRKSWFEKRKESKFEIAVEKKAKRRSGKRKSEEEIETLLLTHFTNPPKIDFGKARIGLKKSRILRIKNPHEYPQTVKVERFPFKKNFSVDCDEVLVEAESSALITIEWCPESDGSYREMILFLVDNAYRLQAFVIGRCETAAEKKKSRGGLLGRRVKRPFSVVQTSNLANIAKSYSPQKDTKKRKNLQELTQAKNDSAGHTNEARISDGFIPPMIIPVENPQDVQNENKNLGNESKSSGKNGHRRSSTYRVPYIDVSPIKTIPNTTPIGQEKKTKEVDKGDVSLKTTDCTELIPKTPSSAIRPVSTRTFVSPNSFLHDSLLSCKGTDNQPVHSTVLPTPERCLMQEQTRKFVSPNSFLKDLNTTKEKLGMKCDNEIPSPNSVLNVSVPHEIVVQQLAFVKKNLKEKGEEFLIQNKIGTEPDGQETTSLSTTNKEEIVLPYGDTYIAKTSINEDLRRGTFTVGSTTLHSSSKRELFSNESTAISKIETVATHSMQYTVSEQSVCQGTFVVQGSQSRAETRKETFGAKSSENFQNENTECDMRRETFAVTDPKIHTDERNFRNLEKSQIGTGNPFSIIPEGTSPRRTTFTVKGRGTRNKPSVRKLSSSESSKIHSKWKRRSQESNFQINEANEVHTPMKFIENEEQNCQDINNSASEDRILYCDKVEVTERLCDDVLPTPERLVTSSIKTPSKTTCTLASRSNVQMTAPHAHCTSINEKFSYMATPERVLMVSHSPTNHNAEHGVHHISTVREEEEEQDSVLIKAFMDKEEEGQTLTCKEKMTVVLEGKSDTTVHELSLDRDHKAVLTTSGSETVTKLRPDIINVDNNNPNQETVTDIYEDGKQISNSDSKNMSGSLTVTKEKPDVILKKTHGDLILPTPERNLNSPCLDVPKNMKYEKVSNSKQLFSPGNLSSSFGSPKRLPDSPLLNDITNRASLTVTKERPSDALMEFTQKQVKSCLFDVDQEEVISNIKDMCPVRENFCDTIPEETEQIEPLDTDFTEHTNKCDGDNDKNNTYDKSENKSFPTTPHQLPSSPNPDMSRRSTHVVEHPKVLDLSKVDRKRLFSPLTTDDRKDEDATEKEQKTDKCIRERLEPTCKVPESRSKTGSSSEPYTAFVPLITETNTCESLDKNMETQQNKLSVKETQQNKLSVKETQQNKLSVKETGSTRSLSHAASRVKKDGKPVPGKQSRSNPTQTSYGKESVVKSKSSNTCIQSNSKEIQSRKRCAAKQNALTEKASKPTVSGVKRNKVGLPQSKLVLTKKCKTALPKHPMPFASKNMYYDERWMEKQERGFTHWLNFLLTPAEEYQLTYNKTKVDAGKLFMENPSSKVLLAPTKEVLSFRAYAATQRLNQLRRAACKLFQSDAVVRVIQKIEAEIDSHRLLIRKDRMVHADLGLKQGILDMLLSFNPLWLRIGLETIYGEIIPVQRNDDVFGLSRFIVTRLLGSPDIAQEYAHPTVPHLYKDGYAAAIARHTLKKFLLLVYFLDHAKTKHLIKHDPCLFCKDVEYKNCKAMLVEFSRCYLAGEGDVTRHLGYLGYIVTHTQVPLDEFEYAVNNIATDLRDGVRLTKVVELLSNKVGLTKKLRAPAISRLQKVHNMEVVFNVLKEHGIDFTKHASPIIPRDIVDGHRERTLRFLWTLILQFQVSVLLSEDQLKEEIEILQKSLKVRNQLSALHRYEQGLKEKRRESSEPELHTKNKLLGLVLKWCRVVCAFYDIKIENFTVSFGDGRALCHLVHHYHPSLLPRESIHTNTMMSYYTESDQKRLSTGDSSLSDSPEPFIVNEDPKLYEELLANEKENFKLLYEKVSELGNIPMMVRSIDMSNTIPDEKVVVTYVTYLCARLLDIRHESRAARIIQLAWRKHMLRKSKRELEVKVKAAIVLQRAFRSYHDRVVLVKRTSAAVVIQSNWRRVLATRKLRQLRWERDHRAQVTAANLIKHHLKGWCRRKQYQRLIRSTVLIQSLVRRYLILKNLRKCHQAATTIQTHYLGYKLTQQTRREFTETRQAVLTIQRWYRDRLTEQKTARERASVTIQAWWRMVFQRKTFTKRKTSAILIQKCVRGYVCRKCFLRKKEAACHIQQKFRGTVEMKRARHTYKQLYKACLYIQRKWKMVQQQKKELMIQSTVRIQSWFRGYITRKQYQLYRHAVVKVQASMRGFLVRKQYTALQKAAVLIQQQYRAVKTMREARSQYRNLKRSTVVVQSLWRRKLCRDSFLTQRKAAIVIQSYYRGYQQRKIYKQVMSRHTKAAVTIQSLYRGLKHRKVFLVQRHAAIMIQKRWKGYSTKRRYTKMQQAARVLQMKWRRRLEVQRVRSKFLAQKRAATVLQSHVRKFLVMRQNKRLKMTAIFTQSMIRMKKAKEEFQEKRRAVCILQARYRAVRKGKKIRREFLIRKGAAITIQSFYRAFKVRQNVAATRIQTSVRRYLAEKKFNKLRQVVITCQRSLRAKIEMKNCVEHYRKALDSVKSIQCWWRGVRCRRRYVQLKSASILLQTRFRGIRQRRKYQMQKSSAVVLQRHIRALFTGRRERMKYLRLHTAVICVQSWWRGTTQRVMYRNTVVNVIKAQSCVRRFLVQRRYLELRKATIFIQQRYRSQLVKRKCLAKYTLMKQSAILIQRCFRQYVQQRQRKIHSAATTIQSYYKAYCIRKWFVQQRNSAVVIQKYTRMFLDRKKYCQIRKSATIIQQNWKSFIARRKFLIQKGAVITLQCHLRRHFSQNHYRKLKNATLYIQSVTRMRNQRRKFLKIKHAVQLIQDRTRAFLQGQRVRRCILIQHWAAITIQSSFRGYMARKQFHCMKKSAVLIQSMVRMHQARKVHTCLKQSAIVLQRRYRDHLETKRRRREYLCKRLAVIRIQAYCRGYLCQKNYDQLRRSAIKLQAAYRRYHYRKRYLKTRAAATVIQNKYKATVLARQTQREFLVMKGAAISIQAWYKGSVQRAHYKHILVCVCRLQATLRGYVVRKHVRELQQAVCVVQRRYREKKLTDRLQNEFLEKKGAAITIQAWYRGYIQRVKYQQCLICVCKLQSVIRGYLERKHLQELRKAACIVQRRYREKRLTQSLHKEFQQKRKSAVCIQRAYRAMMQRRKEILAQQRAIIVSKFVSAVQYNLSAIQIQRAYRKYQTLCAAKKKMNSILCIQHWMRAKLVRLRYLKFMRSITNVQRLCKVYLRRREHSARTIQAAYRKWQARQQEQRKIHAAITLQAVWRGRRVRIKCKSKKLANIRQRIEEANRSATEDKKLCNRTASALDYLLKYKHLSQILDALMHLDVATRLSSQCCVRMVEVHAVQVIYTLIQSCNRSQPHMEIIRYSVSILLNLAKYDKTVGAVYVPGSVDILLELLQIYREKGVIFYRTCTLLGILGIDLNRRMTIASDPKFKDKIKSLHVLVSRKNKIDETRLLRQARQLAAKSFNCTLPVHVAVKKAHKIHPDWVLQRDKMHEIDNPIQAINFVMDNYNITPKK